LRHVESAAPGGLEARAAAAGLRAQWFFRLHDMKTPWNRLGQSLAAPFGRFEGRRGDTLSGWIFDPSAPRQPLAVQLIASNGAQAIALADRHRADVQRAGYGDGYCGFRVDCKSFADARSVDCYCVDSGRKLPGSPRLVAHPPAGLASHSGSWRLGLDAAVLGDACISGHVVDPRQPGRRARLGLYGGGVLLAWQRACLYRLEAAIHGGDGFNGFAFFTPRQGLRLSIVDLDRQLVLKRLRR